MFDSIEAKHALSAQLLLDLPEQPNRHCILDKGLYLIQLHGNWSWSAALGCNRSEDRQIGRGFES